MPHNTYASDWSIQGIGVQAANTHARHAKQTFQSRMHSVEQTDKHTGIIVPNENGENGPGTQEKSS